MPSNNSKNTQEMRDQTAEYILQSGKSVTSAAEELGIDTNTVCRWVRDYQRAHNMPSYGGFIMEMTDSVKWEIEYRKKLMERGYVSLRLLSPEEKFWLKTHPAYSVCFGYPYLSFDIIELGGKECKLTVRSVENPRQRLARAVFIPAANKGYIDNYSAPVYVKGEMTENKKLKTFSPYFSTAGEEISFVVHSPIMKLEVLLECEVGEGQYIHLMPSTVIPFLVMKKERINENTSRYICSTQKNPSVDNFIFDVELSN